MKRQNSVILTALDQASDDSAPTLATQGFDVGAADWLTINGVCGTSGSYTLAVYKYDETRKAWNLDPRLGVAGVVTVTNGTAVRKQLALIERGRYFIRSYGRAGGGVINTTATIVEDVDK